MFFCQRNSSPLFSITRSSSFSVIHLSVNIKINVEKETTLLFFFSLWKSGRPCDFLPLYSGCHTCWLSCFILVCLWCRRTGGRAVGRGWSLLFAVRPCTVPAASKEVTMFTSTHNLSLSSYYEKFFIFCCLESRDHNRTERESKGVGRDILISQKLFLELCGPRGNSFR